LAADGRECGIGHDRVYLTAGNDGAASRSLIFYVKLATRPKNR